MVSALFVVMLISAEPTIFSLAGTGEQGFSGDGGAATAAKLDQPFDVAYDRDGHLYFSDTFNHRIRKVDAKTGTISTVAGSGAKGFGGDGGPATDAKLDEPYGIVFDKANNLYIVDRLNRRIRKVESSTGVMSTVAGDGSKLTSGDGGPATKAGIVEPNGIALDGQTLYIADVAGHRVRGQPNDRYHYYFRR